MCVLLCWDRILKLNEGIKDQKYRQALGDLSHLFFHFKIKNKYK